MLEPIRIVIADDEPYAREHLNSLLALEDDVTVVAQTTDGRETLTALREKNPDIVFLDIQMPFMTGFDVLMALQSEDFPVVVFVTAYDSFALQAFEVNATDYLLKPFSDSKFRASLDKARHQALVLRKALETSQSVQRDGAPAKNETGLKRVLINKAGRIHFRSVEDVEWIETAGNYVALHFEDYTHLMRDSLQRFHQRLNKEHFARIHRTTIVNLKRISHIQSGQQSRYSVFLKSGQELPLSRRHYSDLKAKLGQ